MNRQERELLEAIDSYLEGNETEEELENQELLDLAKSLNELDIRPDQTEKIKVYNKLIGEKKGEKIAMNNKLGRKLAAFALVGAMGISAVQTGFAQEMYQRVKKVINLGHISVEEDYMEEEDYNLPEALKGKIYDKDGKVVTRFTENMKIFTEDGKEISHINMDSMELETEEEMIETSLIKDIDEARQLLKFKLQVPSKLPEGYEFKGVEFYGETLENIGGEYASLVYENKKEDKQFIISQRLASLENSFEAGGSGIEEVTINGRRAVVDKRGNLDIEIDDALVSLLSGGKLSKAQSIEIIESIK